MAKNAGEPWNRLRSLYEHSPGPYAARGLSQWAGGPGLPPSPSLEHLASMLAPGGFDYRVRRDISSSRIGALPVDHPDSDNDDCPDREWEIDTGWG